MSTPNAQLSPSATLQSNEQFVAALLAPFPPHKLIVVEQGGRKVAAISIDAVHDRLDAVAPGHWRVEVIGSHREPVAIKAHGAAEWFAHCHIRLGVRFPDGRLVSHDGEAAVLAPTTDAIKEAESQATIKAAGIFGVGRLLWRPAHQQFLLNYVELSSLSRLVLDDREYSDARHAAKKLKGLLWRLTSEWVSESRGLLAPSLDSAEDDSSERHATVRLWLLEAGAAEVEDLSGEEGAAAAARALLSVVSDQHGRHGTEAVAA